MSLGFVISGAILVEYVFNYPGVGFMLLQAVENEDYPLMQALFLLITVAVLVAIFLVRRGDRPARPAHPEPVVKVAARRSGAPSLRGRCASCAATRRRPAGAVIIFVLALISAFPSWFMPHDPAAEIYTPGAGVSWNHLLGTTSFGQDVFTQVIAGTRESFLIAMIVGAALDGHLGRSSASPPPTPAGFVDDVALAC